MGSVYEALGAVVLCGDVLGNLSASVSDKKGAIALGEGIMRNGDEVIATRCGVVRRKGKFFWIEGSQKRYVPAVNDLALGIVLSKHRDEFKLDIGCAQQGILPVLAFEGATRKNRPNLQVGGLVYARVVVANKDMEPELVCTAANGKAQGFGILDEGYMLKCSLGLCRSLFKPDCVVLMALAEHVPFELAVGHNGRVWVRSEKAEYTVVICNALKNSELLDASSTKGMVKQLFNRIGIRRE